MVGKTLGHYEILEPLGKGGMGEVYRARDTKLDRDVAIKVLPEDFASDPDRLARFEREAKLLAQLNHANIATIYGLEDEGDQRFIVMEVVEGETLAERIGGSGRIEVEEAMEFARQIAEALEAAHDKGVIHRDLKPANVKVTPDGVVKVLDFGLAKSYEIDGSAADVSPDLSHSPTMMEATRAGMIMGTASYMSPEQAKGKPVDKRTDIWSFGALLFEMLTAQTAFRGEDVSETLAAILKDQPAWRELPVTLPATAQALLRRCLRKDQSRRLHDIADARIELEEAMAEPAAGADVDAAAGRRGFSLITVAAIVVAVAALTSAAWFGIRPSISDSGGTKRFVATLPEGSRVSLTPKPIALSPDGSAIAYVQAGINGVQRELFVRPLDQLEPRLLIELSDARAPFFSPDGEWVGFFTGTELRRVSVNGGPPLPITDLGETGSFGASWGTDGTIVFSPGAGAELREVPATGGESVVLLEVDLAANEAGLYVPRHLPGSDAILYTVERDGVTPPAIGLLRRGSGDTEILIEPGSDAHYLPTGHLLYLVDGTFFVAPFDIGSLKLTGQATPIRPGIHMTRRNTLGHFDIAEDGTLVFLEAADLPTFRLAWRTFDNEIDEVVTTPVEQGQFWLPRLSPDGTRIAYRVDNEEGRRIMIHDLARGVQSVFAGDADHRALTWGPDGEYLYYNVQVAGDNDIWKRRADLSEPAELVLGGEGNQMLRDVSTDGDWLLFAQTEVVNSSTYDIWLYSLSEGGEPRVMFNSEGNEPAGVFSPDGRWIGWVSAESGQLEVYVTGFPAMGARTRVSIDGGSEVAWAPDGRTLFFRFGPVLYAVDFDPNAGPTSAPREVLAPLQLFNSASTGYEISPDGDRILSFVPPDLEPGADVPLAEMHFVVNWFEELKRLVPAGGSR